MIHVYGRQNPGAGAVVFWRKHGWLLTHEGHRSERIPVSPVNQFDLDGTLYDGPLWQHAYYNACVRYVPDVRREQFLQTCHFLTQLGQPAEQTFEEMATMFHNDFGLDLPALVDAELRHKKRPDKTWLRVLGARRNRRVADCIQDQGTKLTTVHPTVDILKASSEAGYANSVVTGCVSFLIKPLLDRAGINGELHAVIFPQAAPGEDFSGLAHYETDQYPSHEAKNDPGCYLRGINILRKRRKIPELVRWTAYEDTANGGLSALRAGASVVVIGQPTYSSDTDARIRTTFALEHQLQQKMKNVGYTMQSWQTVIILNSWDLLGIEA